MKNVFVIIPTLNPIAEIFLPFMEKLVKEFNHVIVVNDGSDSKYDDVFLNCIENDPQCCGGT